MEVLNAILFALIALFILVTVHEFGHYWVARRCGVHVERFSIGFGKPFLRFTWDNTEFALAPIPLGGYVKMYGEQASSDDGSEADADVPEEKKQYSFSHKTVYQRMAIVVAGPLANFILAVLVYWMVFMGGTVGFAPMVKMVEEGSIAASSGMPVGEFEPPHRVISVDGESTGTWSEVFQQFFKRIGETGSLEVELADAGGNSQLYQLPIQRWQGDTDSPQFIQSLGLVPWSPELEPVFASISSGSPAQSAGLQAGDRVVQVDSQLISSWAQLRDYVSARPGETLDLRIQREQRTLQLQLTPELVETEQGPVGRIGVAAGSAEWPKQYRNEINYGPIGAFTEGASQTWATSSLILDSLGKLISGQVSTKSLGGPISIAQYAGSSADAGWQSFLMFLAGLSVMLGVVNLLPIPVLDGGHLLFYLVEWAKGSPLSEQIQAFAVRAGMLVLVSVMILALYNDFGRL